MLIDILCLIDHELDWPTVRLTTNCVQNGSHVYKDNLFVSQIGSSFVLSMSQNSSPSHFVRSSLEAPSFLLESSMLATRCERSYTPKDMTLSFSNFF